MVEFENTVLFGHCLDVLKQLPDETFTSIITDPPYGLGKQPKVEELTAYLQGSDLVTGEFHGQNWKIPSVLVWREVFRILKPGGHVLCFGGARTFDLISLGLRAAGFENRDTIAEFGCLQWLYGSGMPKSHNISKAIDRLAGAERRVVGVKPGHEEFVGRGNDSSIKSLRDGTLKTGFSRPWMADPEKVEAYHLQTAPATPEAKQWQEYGTGLKPCWEPILVFRKPIAERTVAAQVLKTGTGALNIDVCRVKHSSSEDFKKHKAGVDAIKTRGGSMDNSWKNSSDLSGANDVTSAGRWPPNALLVHSEGCKKVGEKKVKAGGGTEPHSQAAPISQLEQGPFKEQTNRPYRNYADSEGTETVDAWACVEGCPVKALDAQSGNRPSTLTGRADPTEQHENPGDNHDASWFGGGNSRVYADEGGASRFFPQFEAEDSNEWDCVEGCPVRALDEQSGSCGAQAPVRGTEPSMAVEPGTITGERKRVPGVFHADEGGASRFFPQFEGQTEVEVPFMYCGKVSKREATLSGKIENRHPTKKPVALMRWLIRLVTPKGGIVLDPYCGSGSTLQAAIEEGCIFTGIENDPVSHTIASKRVEILLGKAAEVQQQEDWFFQMLKGGD